VEDTKVKEDVLATFDTVAKAYDQVPFFKTSAQYIQEMIDLEPDAKILDVACGTGNVILQLASKFKDANFLGVDIAQAMLDVAVTKSHALGLNNTAFDCRDIEQLDMNVKFDLITCSYAMFFLPNPVDTLKLLVALLEVGGELIFTTFTDEAFSPSSQILIEELQNYGIALEDKDAPDWKQLTSKEQILQLCEKAGVKAESIEVRDIRYPMNVTQWWELKMSTGYRGMINELSDVAFDTVKQNYFKKMQEYTNASNEVMLIADTLFTKIVKA